MHPHLDRFPCLWPAIGEKYGDGRTKRLLILGESHYQPINAVRHRDPDIWYRSRQDDLSPVEQGEVHTHDRVKEARDFKFGAKGYSIYRESARVMNQCGLGYSYIGDALAHCIFMNYFQRPAENRGQSIKVCNQDAQVAGEVFRAVVVRFAPELVAIVSRLAGRYSVTHVERTGVPFAITPHPGCKWWNVAARSYGGKRGRDLFAELLQQNNWINRDSY